MNDNARSDQKFYLEDSENPLAQFQTPSAETTTTTEIPKLDELEEGIVIALGEGKKPLSILHDDYCEEMAHQIYSQQVNLVIKSSRNFT